jgi:hypothetical protein
VSRRPEDSFKDEVRREARKLGWQINTIETGYTCPGYPDLEFLTGGGVAGTIETKVVQKGTAIRFEAGQIPWHAERARRGGNCWFLVRELKPGIDLIHAYMGEHAQSLFRHGLKVVANHYGPTAETLVPILKVLGSYE